MYLHLFIFFCAYSANDAAATSEDVIRVKVPAENSLETTLHPLEFTKFKIVKDNSEINSPEFNNPESNVTSGTIQNNSTVLLPISTSISTTQIYEDTTEDLESNVTSRTIQNNSTVLLPISTSISTTQIYEDTTEDLMGFTVASALTSIYYNTTEDSKGFFENLTLKTMLILIITAFVITILILVCIGTLLLCPSSSCRRNKEKSLGKNYRWSSDLNSASYTDEGLVSPSPISEKNYVGRINESPAIRSDLPSFLISNKQAQKYGSNESGIRSELPSFLISDKDNTSDYGFT